VRKMLSTIIIIILTLPSTSQFSQICACIQKKEKFLSRSLFIYFLPIYYFQNTHGSLFAQFWAHLNFFFISPFNPFPLNLYAFLQTIKTQKFITTTRRWMCLSPFQHIYTQKLPSPMSINK